MVNWQDISSEFTEELAQEWEKRGFSYEEVRDWVNVGLKIEDAGFAEWLQNIKVKKAEWVLSHGNEQELRQEFQQNQRERERELGAK